MKSVKSVYKNKIEYGTDYTQEYYKTFYKEQSKWKKFLRDLIYRLEWKLVKLKKTSYLLDVGCGMGDFLKFSQTSKKVVGLDISEFAVNYLSKMNINCVCADIKFIPFKQNTFDYVIYNDVIEHLEIDERDASLKEIHRILTVGGRLLVRTPNLDRMLRNYKTDPEFVDTDGDPTHKFFYSRDDLKTILEEMGYKDIVSSSDFLLASIFILPNILICDSILKLISRILSPINNLYGCVFIIYEKGQ